jgi:hypothetical protein
MPDSDAGSSRDRGAAAVVATGRREEIKKHVKELLSDDFAVRAASISSLQKFGADAAEVLVDSLIRNPEQPHALTNFSEALAEIGKPSVNVVLHAFTHVAEIRREKDVYLLEQFVDLVAMMPDRRAAAPLLEQLAKLNVAIQRNGNAPLVHAAEAAKIRIHRVLIGLGEKGGLEDLLAMLGDGSRRVRDGVVEGIRRIGDRRALVPLVRLYDIEEHVSGSGAQAIKEAVREIARRERVTPDDRVFKDVTAAERAVLERVLPRAGTARH